MKIFTSAAFSSAANTTLSKNTATKSQRLLFKKNPSQQHNAIVNEAEKALKTQAAMVIQSINDPETSLEMRDSLIDVLDSLVDDCASKLCEQEIGKENAVLKPAIHHQLKAILTLEMTKLPFASKSSYIDIHCCTKAKQEIHSLVKSLFDVMKQVGDEDGEDFTVVGDEDGEDPTALTGALLNAADTLEEHIDELDYINSSHTKKKTNPQSKDGVIYTLHSAKKLLTKLKASSEKLMSEDPSLLKSTATDELSAKFTTTPYQESLNNESESLRDYSLQVIELLNREDATDDEATSMIESLKTTLDVKMNKLSGDHLKAKGKSRPQHQSLHEPVYMNRAQNALETLHKAVYSMNRAQNALEITALPNASKHPMLLKELYAVARMDILKVVRAFADSEDKQISDAEKGDIAQIRNKLLVSYTQLDESNPLDKPAILAICLNLRTAGRIIYDATDKE